MNITKELKEAIEAYKAGDKGAFDIIYGESNKYIHTCITNTLNSDHRNEDMINDIMQDTYLEISESIGSLEKTESFLFWAGTIAKRKAYKTLKANDKYVLLGEDESFANLPDDSNTIPEEIVLDKEKQIQVRAVINTELTEDEKDCVVGYYYNNMKQREIAEELDMPQNTVYSNLYRAKSKMRKALEGIFVLALVASIALLFVSAPLIRSAMQNKEEKTSPQINDNREVIPKGGSYYILAENKTLVAGERFPSKPAEGDVYSYGDYQYTYITSKEYWAVVVKDKSKDKYEMFLSEIVGKKVGDLSNTFADCVNMTEVPVIPEGVESMVYTFKNCKKLTGEVVIDANPTLYFGCFDGVDLQKQLITLTGSSNILNELKETGGNYIPIGASYYITSTGVTLIEGAKMPEVVLDEDEYITEEYTYRYDAESGLWDVKVSDSRKSQYGELALEIVGETKLDLTGTFENCTNLVKAPVIPENVVKMDYTFYGCQNLTGEIVINANPISYWNCFEGISFSKNMITLSGSSNMLNVLKLTQLITEEDPRYIPKVALDMYELFCGYGVCCNVEYTEEDLSSYMTKKQIESGMMPVKCTCCNTVAEVKAHMSKYIDESLINYNIEDNIIIHNSEVYVLFIPSGGNTYDSSSINIISQDNNGMVFECNMGEYGSFDFCVRFTLTKTGINYVITNVEYNLGDNR